MDKSTGKELVVNGVAIRVEKVFSPSETGKNGWCDGYEDIEFTFDSKAIKGKTVVVFEKLYAKDLDENNKEIDQWIEITNHEDIADEGQSVHFTDLHTKATDKNGNKTIKPGKKITIVDKVSYTNLIVGKRYTVKGVLMVAANNNDKKKKKTSDYAVSSEIYSFDLDKGMYVDQNGYICKPLLIDGKPVVSEVTFTAKQADGTVNMKFTFDASKLGRKQIVVFEDLYTDGIRIGTHADITDKGQTVTFKNNDTSIAIRTDQKISGHGTVKTGDVSLGAIFLLLLLSLMALVGLGMTRLNKGLNLKQLARDKCKWLRIIHIRKPQFNKLHINRIHRMKMKISRPRAFAFFVAFLLVLGMFTGVKALAEEQETVKENEKIDGTVYDYVITRNYETDDISTTCDFDDTYKDAKSVNVSYDVEEAIYSKKKITTNKVFKKLKKKDDGLLDKTITQEGIEYHLINVAWKEIPVTEEVSYTLDYGYLTEKPVPKKTYHYSYESPNTKQKMELDLPLKELKEGSTSWVDGFKATATFKNIEGEEFTLGDHTFNYAENLSLTEADYEELIKMLGYDTSLYRLTSFAWKGAPYEHKKDEHWRDATLTGQQYATSYSAIYSDEVKMDSMYEAVGTYEAEIVDESTAPVYKMKAVAMYQKDNSDDGKKEEVWKIIAVFVATHPVGISLLAIIAIVVAAVTTVVVIRSKKKEDRMIND